jgi:ribosomal protein L3 glutamine methyltransferase
MHDRLDRQARAAVEELRTVTDLVRWGVARLDEARVVFGHGTDNSVDEALALVLHAAGLRPDAPESLYASRLTAMERRAAVDLIVRRIRERVPTPYLTGCAWFAGLEFACDARALVPRSPIAEWIERGFEPWLDPDAVERVLEIGTGGGSIAVACAMAFPNATVDAIDVSDAALDLARENCMTHDVDARVRLFQSDVYAEVNELYDLIVSNPPYVDAETMATLDPEYLHEPRIGLEAGTDGLDCVRRILADASAHLRPGGVLVCEVGASRHALESAYPTLPFTWLELARGGEGVFLLTGEQLGEQASW